MPDIHRRPVRSPGLSLTVLGVLISAAIAVLFFTDLEIRYRDRIATAKTDAQNFSRILAEHTALTFDDVDEVLGKADAIRRNTLSAKSADPGIANAALRQLQKSSSILVAIGWTDASGELIAHSYDRPPPRLNISDMSHFVAQRDGAGSGLFIAPPFRSATGDKWFTAVSRRISNADGSFAGIITAPIDQSYFIKLYRSIDLRKGGSVVLLHREGRILAREPFKAEALGRSYADGPLFTQHLPRSETGSFETTSVVDGVARVASYTAVPGLPLVLLVTYARSDVLAPWYRHLYTFGLLVIAIIVVILFGTFLLAGQTNRLARQSEALARTNARFDATLGNMPHGLSMFDRHKRLVIWNARYAEIYQLPPSLLRVGTHVNAIMADLVTRGILKGETGPAAVANKTAMMDRIPADAHGSRVEEFSDGRLIRISRQPMEEGGWVATHEDITEARRAEALLRENSAELRSTNDRFDAALSNMPHGVSMFDADERLLISNDRYREMYGLTDEQVTPGTPLKLILRNFKEKNEEADFSVDEFAQTISGRAPQIVMPADGRIILITRTPMANGGWVATHQDITETRRHETLLAENAAEMKRTNERFDVAISNMSQGLCLFDADKRLVISNKRYQEMYGLPDGLVRPGTPLSRILQFYQDRGDADEMGVEDHVRLIPTQSNQKYEPADGRKILIERKPLPDGGWVATHADVTERERGEQLLAEKAAELEAMNVRFDVALNNMSQGLCMFDADQKVVVSNARYAEIYRLSPDQIRPGTPLREILEFRHEKGTHFHVAPDVYLEQNVKAESEVQELADGRVIAIARHMMQNGGWLTTHEDITERARNEKRIAFLAQHDLLTGLANRALFSEKLEDAAKRLQRHGTTFTVLMLDLDKFKNVNDTLGHPAGDQLLVEVAQRLSSSLRDTDVLARLGGDEFAIIQENEKNQSEGAIALALRIIGLIEQPFDLGGHRVRIGTSIGMAFAPEHGVDVEVLMKKADVALYAAKSGGRNDFRIFQPELTEAADNQKSMENELRGALSRSEFELHYQPVIDVKTRRTCGAEAFVRWNHPSRGMLARDQFLPLAVSTGLMLPLGEWILQQACCDAAAWPPHIKVAVNISAIQFSKGNLFDLILCALADSGLSPERLELEISDVSVLEQNHAMHLQTIRQLKNIGVSMVLDHCGAGFTSASYLAGFPFDKIKIDKPVTQGFADRRDCAAVIASVMALARGLDIATAAKGVESSEQFEALRAAGVDFAQGYLFGKPAPHSELDFDAGFQTARNVA